VSEKDRLAKYGLEGGSLKQMKKVLIYTHTNINIYIYIYIYTCISIAGRRGKASSKNRKC
jgi:hypothetical protein